MAIPDQTHPTDPYRRWVSPAEGLGFWGAVCTLSISDWRRGEICFNEITTFIEPHNQAGGINRAAVKLEESGNSVIGFAVSANESMGIATLLDEYERREYSSEFYEKNIVEVITERGDRLLSYIYHRRELNLTNLIPSGDWFLQ